MPSVSIDPRVFEHAPGYARCVFTVNLPKSVSAPVTLAEALRSHSNSIGNCHYVDDRIAEWDEIFRLAGINPNRYPPSLKSLVKRCRSGKGVPYVNDLVAVMNLASLMLRQPCGADDLSEVGSELQLRPAQGTETFVPLGDPDVVERPEPGELVYVDRQNNNVLCRRFIWRNGHLTRLTEQTSKFALNVDISGGNSFLILQARVIVPRLFWDFFRADAKFHLLDVTHPYIKLEV